MRLFKIWQYRLFRRKSGKYVAEVRYSYAWCDKPTHVKRFISKNCENAALAYQRLIEEFSV